MERIATQSLCTSSFGQLRRSLVRVAYEKNVLWSHMFNLRKILHLANNRRSLTASRTAYYEHVVLVSYNSPALLLV